MIARNDARRNNPNPSEQVPGAETARVDAARLQQAAAVEEQERGIGCSAVERRPNGARSQDGASTASTLADPTASTTPVLDMQYCIEHLDAIRKEAGNSTLSEFSDYWAPDHSKTTPNRPHTFEPVRMVKGNNPLWASFYNGGQVRQGPGGAPDPDSTVHPRQQRLHNWRA